MIFLAFILNSEFYFNFHALCFLNKLLNILILNFSLILLIWEDTLNILFKNSIHLNKWQWLVIMINVNVFLLI